MSEKKGAALIEERMATTEEYILSAEEILAAPDMKPVKVPCPEWGGTVLVRPLTSWESDEWENKNAEAKADGFAIQPQFRANICAQCLCRADGSPLFTPAQVKALSQKSAAPINRIMNKIFELSGMKADAVDKAEKNSGAAPTDNSGTN